MKNFTLKSLLKSPHQFWDSNFLVHIFGISLVATNLVADSHTKKDKYLSFHPPPALLFRNAPPVADRARLLSLKDATASSSPAPVATPDSLPSDEEIPLISYSNEEAGSEPVLLKNDPPTSGDFSRQSVLPPADPFEQIGTSMINSTDQLIQIIEQDGIKGSNRTASLVQFVPPFSIDTTPLQVQSKATYRKVEK